MYLEQGASVSAASALATWTLQPGNNTIAITGTGTTAATNINFDYRVRWSAINNETDWVENVNTQSDYQDIPDGGQIFGVGLAERDVPPALDVL